MDESSGHNKIRIDLATIVPAIRAYGTILDQFEAPENLYPLVKDDVVCIFEVIVVPSVDTGLNEVQNTMLRIQIY